MHQTMSYSNAAVLFTFLWATISCLCYNTDCDFTESYDEVITVSINEPVQVTKYKWCLDIPPRCPDNKREFRTVRRNVSVPKMRKVKRCCEDQIQLYDNCVPRCAEDQCPNIQCAPGTDRCKCKSGYIGHLCKQRCDIGRWGLNCANVCDKACPDCDHRTGCCKTAATGLSIFCGGGTGRLPARQTVAVGSSNGTVRKTNDGRNCTSERKTDEVVAAVDRSSSTRFRMLSTTIRLQTATWEPTAVDEVNETKIESTAGKQPATETTFTPLEATALKYDELVTRLVWIFAMTVVAIAMLFVIMFVVFFNCYGASKSENANTAATRNPWPQQSTDKVRETCITSQNLCHVPPDRYTKTPTLYASTNVDLPIHPEIFCPVFSAPHYTGGSSLYDSPQPLYEILC
ncbi:uncharacterized protein LOC111035420 [Myzus persicae]|uniref:uncharacterized protein LOC111035420 n=1 Tax=Myzus persicae TaxID=13164 RepID=UPI000B934F22|nr:uncharacterized protein LOC111035420 [Myzus persicae]